MILSSSLVCSSALADVECDPDFPRRCSAPILAGETAPISGQVLSVELAIELAVTSSQAQAREAAELKRALGKQKADLDLSFALERNKLVGDTKVEKARSEMLQAELDKSPGTWTVLLTVVLTASVIYGSAWAWGHLRPEQK